jgi:hypothetical protein
LRTSQTRRFPPPWSVEETEACFIVRDAGGQALAYVYFEEEPGRGSAAKLLTYDEARRGYFPVHGACTERPACLNPSMTAVSMTVTYGVSPSTRPVLSVNGAISNV